MAITPLPTPPNRSAPSTFSTLADAFLGALPVFQTEMNAEAVALTLNATTDVSTSSVLIGLGAKTFTVTAAKSFLAGMWLSIADAAAPTTNSMIVQITSYSGTTLVVNCTRVFGSGTKASWVISQSVPGAAAVYLQNLLTNSGFGVWSNSTLENARTLPDATSVATGTSIASDAHALTAGMLVKDAAGTPLVFEVVSVTNANTFVVDRTGWTDGQAYEVTPGCVAANGLGPDGWFKDAALDVYRQHNDATYTKAGSFYSVKLVNSTGASESLMWPSDIFNKSSLCKKFAGRTVTYGAWVYSLTASDNVMLTHYDDVGGWVQSGYVPANTWTWVEMTWAVASNLTDFRIAVETDGTAADVAYISQPMLVFGFSCGQGNYSAPHDEQIMLEAPFTLTGYSAAAPSDATINLEAASNGKIGKGIKRAFGYHYGENSAADKYLLLGSSSSVIQSRLISQVAGVPTSLPFDIKADSNGDMYIDVEDGNWSAYNINITGIGQ